MCELRRDRKMPKMRGLWPSSILTHTPGGTNEAFTITEDESLKLEAQIQHIMDARQKALQDGKQVIIKH